MKYSTINQRSSVRMCEKLLGKKFGGNINSFSSCNSYLSRYLEKAKKELDKRRESKRDSLKNFYEEYGSIILRRKSKRG